MVRFIDTHRAVYGVEPICTVLPIAPSLYYELQARQRDLECRPPRARRDERLSCQIERAWHEEHEVYGARNVRRQSQSAVWRVDVLRSQLRGSLPALG